MTSNQVSIAESDPTVARISEVSLRMMAGAISPECRQTVRDTVHNSPGSYPWERVVELVVADPVDGSDLVQRGLEAQRDWIARGGVTAPVARVAPESVAGPRAGAPAGRQRPKSFSVRVKTWIAIALVRGMFYGFFAVAFVFVLLLAKAKWPEVDIYRLLEWLREVAPRLFGGG